MSHPTTDRLMAADTTVIEHMERCARCRESLEPDVDLVAVWQRIEADLTAPQLVGDAGDSSSRRSWTAGAVAAVAVTVLLVPVALFVFTGSEAPIASPDSQPDLGLPVQSPQVPPEPIGDEPDLLPAPPDSPAFEMSFTVGDTIRGRLIWARPDYFEAARVNTDGVSTGFDYALYRSEDGTGYADPDDSTLSWVFPSGTTLAESLETVASTPYVPDPDIPWHLLIDGDLDTVLDELDLESEHATDTTHPLADSAWDNGTSRVEVTDDGIPVLIARDGAPTLTVESLDRRVLFRGEVGNNVDVAVDWALSQAGQTTPEQRETLSRGLLTLADYRAAAQAAAECAGVETSFDDATKLFSFPDTAADCVATWVSDIEQVWRLDAQLVTADEQTAMYYEARGMPEVVELYRAEQGPERPLASGEGWAIAISERGTGFCTRTSVTGPGTGEGPPGMFGEGCFTPGQMPIPGVLSLDGGWTYADGEIDRGRLLGLVHQDAVQIEVTFSSGATETIVPGAVVEFGYRGFGYLYDAGELGAPLRFDVYGMSGGVQSYETGACDPDAEYALPAEERAGLCR